MSLLDKLGDLKERLFCRVYGVFVDLTTGGIAVGVNFQDAADDYANLYSFAKKGNKFKAVKQPAGFGVEIPAYAIRTPVDKLAPGDLILGEDGNNFLFYVGKGKGDDEVENTTIRVLVPESGTITDVAVSVEPLLGGAGVLAVQTSFLQGGNLLLLTLLGDDDDGQNPYAKAVGGSKLNDLLPLLLMQQGGGAGLGNLFGGGEGGGNNLLPLLLLGGGKGGDLLPLLLMQQNGGAGLFGGEGLNNLLPLLLMKK